MVKNSTIRKRINPYNKPGLKDSEFDKKQYRANQIQSMHMRLNIPLRERTAKIKKRAYGILVKELLKQRLREKKGIRKAVVIQKYCRRYLAQKKLCDMILNPRTKQTNMLPKYWMVKTSSEYPGLIYYYNTKYSILILFQNSIFKLNRTMS